MKSFACTLLLFFGWMVASLLAGLNETLPTYHWAYDYIEQLRIRGYFEDFFVLSKPYTRGAVAQWLLTLDAKIKSEELKVKESDLFLIERLKEEFREELEELTTQRKQNLLKYGTLVIQDFKRDEKDQSKLRGIYRSRLGFSVGDYIDVLNVINFDQNLGDDPDYMGKKWRGFTVFTEQAYAQLRYKNFGFKFGRDFLKWGSGRSGNLLISDYSRPMDFFSLTGQFSFFRFSYFTAILDPIELPDTSAVRLKSNSAQRYLTAHRIDLKLLKGRLNFGLTEAVLYGGPERNLEFAYSNPLTNYFGEVENDPEHGGNLFATFEFDCFPKRNLEIYGELLIDDLQVEKTGPGDLEPSEIGMMVGFQIADPFSLDGTNLWLEYTRITNRTYNTLTSWEKFLHRRKPIGYFLGNDFDRWELNINRWFTKDLQIGLGFERIRRGEGRIEKVFDTPWMNYTVEEGYSESFPSGIVEKTNAGKIEILYQPSADWRFYLFARYSDVKNANNSLGVNDNGWFLKVGVWFEWAKTGGSKE